jgi:AbrB family looped-hinge helix DNA binding protein
MRNTTKLTSKGQVVIPKSVRDRLRWRPGTRLEVETLPDGVRLKAPGRKDRKAFDALLDRVTGFLTEGDPIGDLEAEHRAEIEADARWRRS